MNVELVREGRRFAEETKEAKEERDKALDEKHLAEDKKDTVVAKLLSLEEALIAHHDETTLDQIPLDDSGKDLVGVCSSSGDAGLDLAAAKDQGNEGKKSNHREVE
ncbi:hypothetical protein RHMOL_Rhmol02G0178700 [Rhododendron molle]|uniref:Uncharacterized protein n=1 Tax=Rhododendron molle TaxID=49168 RepID=A0ACC0PRS7_RHOML|nr:hypothetical protein RHMOL_Rhmol02G0178700 [Rhododendron molle]